MAEKDLAFVEGFVVELVEICQTSCQRGIKVTEVHGSLGQDLARQIKYSPAFVHMTLGWFQWEVISHLVSHCICQRFGLAV